MKSDQKKYEVANRSFDKKGYIKQEKEYMVKYKW